MRVVLSSLIAIGLGIASPSYAKSPTVEMYQAASGDDKALFEFYVWGLAEAYMWATIAVEEKGGEPLFCPPEQLAVTNDQKISILERWLEHSAGESTTPRYLALEVLLALEYAFPCEVENPRDR